MQILYPLDWEVLEPTPQLVVFEPRITRTITPCLIQLVDGNEISCAHTPFKTTTSDTGTVRLIQWNGLKDGQYIVRLFEGRFDTLIGEIGFFVRSSKRATPIGAGINTIETCLSALRLTRMVANGIGKSGTTWLYRLLGSLPGMSCVNMSERGLSGINHLELQRLSFGEVFHGHLRYGYEVARALDQLDYHNVHICRDLRDVIVSEYFHKFHMDAGNHRPDLLGKNYRELLAYDNIWKWSSSMYAADDVLSWNRSRDCLMLRYEDLVSDTANVLADCFRKLGLPTHEDLTNYIVYRNDFSVVTGRQPGNADPRSPLRNGVPGNWKQYLDKDTSERIYENFRFYFETFGYSCA